MFTKFVSALAFVVGAMAASNGDVGICDIRSGLFGRGTSRMPWASAPVYKNWYNIRTVKKNWYGSSQVPTVRKYKPGKAVHITLSVTNREAKFRGMLMYAYDRNHNRVGTWDLTHAQGDQTWWHPPICGNSAVIHQDADEKNFFHSFRWVAPSRNVGDIWIRALIKQGPANTGKFFWSNTIKLTYSSDNGQRWFRGDKGQSCNSVCSRNRMSCDANLMEDYAKRPVDLQAEVTVADYQCKHWFGVCDNMAPRSNNGQRHCFYRDTSWLCRKDTTYHGSGKTLPAVSCSASNSGWSYYRICGCRPAGVGASIINGCGNINCGENGQCSEASGQCVCDDGFTGDYCSIADNTTSCRDDLQNGDETGIDCGGPDCPPCTQYHYYAHEWEGCTEQCGGGTRSRVVECRDAQDNVVSDGLCSDLDDPPLVENCNEQACATYSWTDNEWTACDATCGAGNQTRPVCCVTSLGGLCVLDEYCSDPKPETVRQCTGLPACTANNWRAYESQACSGECGPGIQQLNVSCHDSAGGELNYTECDAENIPFALEKACMSEPCDNLVRAEWDTCEWDECTLPCGGETRTTLGQQTRELRCIDAAQESVAGDIGFDDNYQGALLDPVLCDAALAPASTLFGCNPQACTDFNWGTSSWSLCVNGKRTRVAFCRDTAGRLSDGCDDETKPLEEQDCTVGQCATTDYTLLEWSAAPAKQAVSFVSAGFVLATSALMGGKHKTAIFLVVLLSYLQMVSAHNWINSPSRATAASTAKGCIPRNSPNPHVQVRAGQDFEIEWATGHTGSNSKFYFTIVHENDQNELAYLTPSILDDYLNRASGSQVETGKKYHRTFDGRNEDSNRGGTAAAIYNRQLSAGTITRDPVMNEGYSSIKARGANTKLYEYKSAHTNSDRRASYTSGVIRHVSRFHNHFHAPTEVDVAKFKIPSGSPPGMYIVYMSWRGYYDCVDVHVTSDSVSSSNRYGIATSPKQWEWSRVDHCTMLKPYAYWTPCEIVTNNATQTITTSNNRDNDNLRGINVVTPYIQGLKHVRFKSTPLNVKMAQRNCQSYTNQIINARDKRKKVSYAIRPATPSDVNDEMTVSLDPEDPTFYNTCFYRSVVRTWQRTIPAKKENPLESKFAVNKCLRCYHYNRIKSGIENIANYVPDWSDITDRCQNNKCGEADV